VNKEVKKITTTKKQIQKFHSNPFSGSQGEES
jgi:hypothetical protein